MQPKIEIQNVLIVEDTKPGINMTNIGPGVFHIYHAPTGVTLYAYSKEHLTGTYWVVVGPKNGLTYGVYPNLIAIQDAIVEIINQEILK